MPRSLSKALCAILALTVATLVASCDGGYRAGPDYRVEDVAHEIKSARKDRSMRLYAASLLTDADLTLDKARTSNDASLQQHLAYMAQRKVDIARSTTGLMLARESLAHLPDHVAPTPQRSDRMRDRDSRVDSRPAQGEADSKIAMVNPAYGKRPSESHRPYNQNFEKPVTVIDASEFATDAADWQKSLAIESKLRPILRYLRQNPDARILIEGFVEDFGNKEYALNRSLALAESVKSYLTGNGIEGARVLTLGNRTKPDAADRMTDTIDKAADGNRIEISLFAR